MAGLGDWGIVEGLIYDRWEEKAFNIDSIRKKPGIKSAFGLDFGYTNDPSALFCGLVDTGPRPSMYLMKSMSGGSRTRSCISGLRLRVTQKKGS